MLIPIKEDDVKKEHHGELIKVNGVLEELKCHKVSVNLKGRTVTCYKIVDYRKANIDSIKKLRLDCKLYPNFVIVYEASDHIIVRRRDGVYIMFHDEDGFLPFYVGIIFNRALALKPLTIREYVEDLIDLATLILKMRDDKYIGLYRYLLAEILAMLVALDLVIIYQNGKILTLKKKKWVEF
jgi:hypothetical protein